MLLKSLRLENIRSYTSQSIDFSEGSTLLIGDIGSGKTTILLAIEFALFGLIKGDVSGSTLLRHGKKEGSVELSFNIENNEVIIKRKLKRKDDTVAQDSGNIIINNNSFDGTPIELKSKILELFGYPQELINKNTSLIYRYTVYTPQEDMKRILFESRDERLDTLRKIFNIDKYKRIRENALAYAKELRNTKKILEAKVSDLDSLNTELEKLFQSKKRLSEDLSLEQSTNNVLKDANLKKLSEIKGFEDNIAKLGILKKDLEIASINLKNKKLDLDRNNKDLGMIEYRIKEYNSKLSDLGVIDIDENTIRESLNDSEDKLNKINSAKEIISKRLEDKERDLQNLAVDDIAALNYKTQSITKRLESRSSKERSLEESKDLLERTVIELNIINVNKFNSSKIINQLKDLSTCPTCLQNVDFSHKVKIVDKESANVQSCERKFSELSIKKKELESQVNTLKSEIENLRKDEMELRETSIKISNIAKQQELKTMLTKDIEELKLKKDKLDRMDVNKLVESISRNRKILSNVEVRKHIIESLKEKDQQKSETLSNISKSKEEFDSLTRKYSELSENIGKYADTEKEYMNKKTELDSILKELKESDIKIAGIRKDMENNDQNITRISQDIDNKNNLKKKITYIGELNFWISEHFISLSSTIEKAIMQKIQVEFNELFQKWFNMLMDDENLEVRIDDEFTPVIMQNNYETDITNLSGGEKTSVALAYRLALNKVINDLINNIKTDEILILDEPTDGFSSEQLDKMRDVLHELDIRQMIMVSHEPKMESFVQNIIRVNKNEHDSHVQS